MSKGVAGAIALLLFWIAFASFFVAFHPGGIKLADGTPAQNPRDVILYFIQKWSAGISAPTQTGSGGSGQPPQQALLR